MSFRLYETADKGFWTALKCSWRNLQQQRPSAAALSCLMTGWPGGQKRQQVCHYLSLTSFAVAAFAAPSSMNLKLTTLAQERMRPQRSLQRRFRDTSVKSAILRPKAQRFFRQAPTSLCRLIFKLLLKMMGYIDWTSEVIPN